MRFKVDEDLPLEVSSRLLAAGYDVSTVRDENMLGASDAEVWEAAQSEARCIVTADKGFADVRVHEPGSHNGVVLLRLGHESRAGYIALIDRLVEEKAIDAVSGSVTVASPAGIRVHKGA